MQDNHNDKAKVYLIGGAIITLGILLLASLLNMINAVSIYGYAMPIILLIAGFTMVSAKDKQFHFTALGLLFLLSGLVSLLVRLNVISGKVVNGILGFVLVIAGIAVLMHIADRHAVKKTDQ